jgi:hypothetical protein
VQRHDGWQMVRRAIDDAACSGSGDGQELSVAVVRFLLLALLTGMIRGHDTYR